MRVVIDGFQGISIGISSPHRAREVGPIIGYCAIDGIVKVSIDR